MRKWWITQEKLSYETGWYDMKNGGIIQHNLNSSFECLNWSTSNKAVAIFEILGNRNAVQVVVRPDLPSAYVNIIIREK